MKATRRNIKKGKDSDLLQAYLQTNDLAFLAELYNRYIHLVYGVCLKYFRDRQKSQDAVSEIFESLIIKVTQSQIENFKSWLYVVTKNHCLMEIRKFKSEKNQIKAFYADQFMESTEILHPIDEERDTELERKLQTCIEKLKHEQKQCIDLFYFKKLCYREIAKKLDLKEKKIKSYIQNGKRNLKLCLEQNQQNYE